MISEEKRRPKVFVWKTVALVVTSLIAIFVVIDICLLIYLDNNPVPPTNATFVGDVIFGSTIVTEKEQVRAMLSNMLRANPDTKFQNAELLVRGTGE